MNVEVKEVIPKVKPTYEVALSGLTKEEMEILASVACRTVSWDDGEAGRFMENLYRAVTRGTGNKTFSPTWGSCGGGGGFDLLGPFRYYGR